MGGTAKCGELITAAVTTDTVTTEKGKPMSEITNPIKAIRAFCMECSCGSSTEVKNCTISRCPLYPFRFGKNPYRHRREMTEEEKQMLADRLREARKNIGSSVEKMKG